MTAKAGHGIGLLLTIVLIALIFIYILPRTGSLVYALLINTLVGFVVIFLVNAIFGLGIKYDLLVLIFVAVFGLLAVAILIILNLMGVSTEQPKSKR
jgi:lipopolysaccharide export LptBFGC system permease protein LptF